MARVAIGRRAGEHIIDMAARARDIDMGAREREGRVVVIESSPSPGRRRMSDRAILWESRRDVIGIGRSVEIRQVAGDTGG